MKKITIEIVKSRNALDEIAYQWNELVKPFETPLLCYEWFVSCADAFYKDEGLCIIIVRSSGNITAIAPMVIAERNRVKWLEFMGVSFLYEPCGILYDSEYSLRTIWKVIVEMKYPVQLQRVPFDSLVAKELQMLTKFKGIFVNRKSASSAYVPINSDWETFYNSISARRRYDLRRARKRAEKNGNISIKIFCPDLKELDQYLDVAFQIEAAGWKGRKGSALLENKKLQRFFRAYSTLICRDKTLRLCFLYIGDDAVAMQIGLEHGNRFWVLKIGYDEKWAKCSPGVLLTMETVRYAFHNNLKAYEFLGSEEPWLSVWTKHYHDYSSVVFFPKSLYGLFGLCREMSRVVKKKIERLDYAKVTKI